MNENDNMLEFDNPICQSSNIKVIGVGGGGCNAVNHMCRQGINGVDFIVCNTDIKALNASPVTNKIVLGNLGAGNKPERAQRAAERQADEIREKLSGSTKMLYITAGMGGGTGTGAAPVIAKIAKSIELDDEDTKHILVVAVVTTPFTWEGPVRLRQAEMGINELRQTVDSMIVINNDKIRSLGGNMLLTEGFVQANNVLFEAVKGISDIITGYGIVNRDFQDINTVMEGSGRALMGSGFGKGEDRAKDAVVAASTSSLLNDSDITGAHNMLLYFYFNQEHVITMDEMEEVTHYLRSISRNDDANIIWGAGYDDTLDDELHIILIATSIDAGRKTTELPRTTSMEDSFGNVANPVVSTLPTSLEPKMSSVEESAVAPAAPVRKVRSLDDDPVAEPVSVAEKQEVEKIEVPVIDNQQSAGEPYRQKELVSETVQQPVQQPVLELFQEPVSEPLATFSEPVKETVMDVNISQFIEPASSSSRGNEPKSMDVTMVTNRADRVKHLYELLHNRPDGPQIVENLTTEQLSSEAVFETPHSSVSDVPQTRVTPDGRIEKNNNFLFQYAD